VIRAVVFDLDETLLQRNAAIAAFITDQYARHAQMLAPIGRDRFISRFLAIEDEGRASKARVYPALVAELGLARHAADDLFADYTAHYPGYATLSPGAQATLISLRADGRKTGIISNGSAVVQNGKIDATGLRPLVDAVLISETEGLRKPDRRIFELALHRIGVAAHETIFVGDNPIADVDGARNAGLIAVWFRGTSAWPEGVTPPEHAVTTLPEVLALARRLSG
jgi:putative hydrolase of the HAD superfamily